MQELKLPAWWAGISLAVVVSIASVATADWFGIVVLGFAKSPVSAIMIAILLGMLLGNLLRVPENMLSGVRFCACTVLRIGIMLLGIRLSLIGAGQFTLVALPFVIVAIVVGLSTVRFLGRSMGLSNQLTGLIAVGTSICGCTAIVATAPLIKANESEVSYSIACVTVFGLAAMFLYPLLAHLAFPAQPELAGLFLGTSIHETAQVAGAGLMYETQYNAPAAMDIATVTKLVRNLCMIAVIPLVGLLYGAAEREGGESAAVSYWSLVPWFIIGFALMSAVRTIGDIGDKPFGVLDPAHWSSFVAVVKSAAEYCLLVAMSAVGLTSMIGGIVKIGIRPFALGLFAALLIGGVSFALISLFGEQLTGLVT